MKRVLVACCLLIALTAQSAWACPVCFGAPDSPMTKGMNNAILFLLAIVGFIWIGFIALFWSFWQRARALRMRREQFHVLQGGLH